MAYPGSSPSLPSSSPSGWCIKSIQKEPKACERVKIWARKRNGIRHLRIQRKSDGISNTWKSSCSQWQFVRLWPYVGSRCNVQIFRRCVCILVLELAYYVFYSCLTTVKRTGIGDIQAYCAQFVFCCVRDHPAVGCVLVLCFVGSGIGRLYYLCANKPQKRIKKSRKPVMGFRLIL